MPTQNLPLTDSSWRSKLAFAALAMALAGVIAPASAANFQYRHFIYGLTAPVSPPSQAQQQAAAEIVVALTGGPSLPAGEVNWPYSYDLNQLLTVTGDTAYDKSKVKWEIQAGELPAGLTLGTDGVISGTPTTKDLMGNSFQILSTYKTKTGQQAYTIVVNGAVLHVTQISTGGDHTCVVTTSGGAKCWGANANGQLGDGSLTNRLSPVDVYSLTSGVAQISAGANHSCAVTTAGAAKCWGAGSSGQLGDGSSLRKLTPVTVSSLGTGVASISAGNTHSCAVTTTGGAKCWGWNYYGTLGDGTSASSAVPVNVKGLTTGVAAIVATPFYYHSCAITTGGAVKCWGYNAFGQLGTGTKSDYSPVSDVPGLTSGVTQLALGWGHGCALISDGTVKCWGYNTNGQVGDGTTTERLTPVTIPGLSGVARITAGQQHACAATASEVKCWGLNSAGQLGDNTVTQRNSPVSVSNLSSGVLQLTGGLKHTCALTTAGPKCWGSNSNGQLGNNSTTSNMVPVNVQP